MNKPDVKISLTEIHTFKCCDVEISHPHQYLVMNDLMNHIRSQHPDLFSYLEMEGRKLARSQIGCGYYDSDDSNGWEKAQSTFRDAWIKHALKDYINNNRS